jgi:hypothetical protein
MESQMTKTYQPKHRKWSKIDVHEVLAARRQVASIWSIEDVQAVRPNLNGDQAWQVLQECERQHDCEFGFTWLLIANVADELSPRSDADEE